MTERELMIKYPRIQPYQIAWRLAHPLIPEEKYARILQLEAVEASGNDWYGNEEEAYEILMEYYPGETE